MLVLESLMLVALGLVIGSFAGAVSWRHERNISISSGRSVCDNCRKKISWYDNIPVISYLLLAGKCRNCGKRVSPRYPIIEFSFALIFLSIFMFQDRISGNINFFPSGLPGLITLLGVATVFGIIFITDFEKQLILDSHNFILLGMVIFVLLYFSGNLMFERMFSGFLASFLLLSLNLFTNGKGMGLGDVKLAIPIGMILGIKLLLLWFSLSFIVGAIVGLILIFFKMAKFGKHIAFGPFMIFAFASTCLFGSIMSMYIWNI